MPPKRKFQDALASDAQEDIRSVEENNEVPSTSKLAENNDKVTSAEIWVAAIIAELNISINAANRIVDTMKDFLPYPSIAQSIKFNPSRWAYIIKDLAKISQDEIVNSLKKNKFSIIIEETTDCRTTRTCAVLVKYFDPDTESVQTRILDLLDIYSSSEKKFEGSTGQHLYDLIVGMLEQRLIPLDNLIGFAADGASYIIGSQNSLTSRIEAAAPGITIFKFAGRSIHLCASNAAKTLPIKCEYLIRSIYKYFALPSYKMKSKFIEFQEFSYVEPHKYLHVSQTRWLSLHMAVARVLEQWQSLTLFFSQKYLEDRLSSTTSIYEALRDPSLQIYFKFLDFILPYFDKFNKLFQRNHPTIHILYNKCRELYANILRFYILPTKVTSVQLLLLDPSDDRNFVPLNQLYLGPAVQRAFQDSNMSNPSMMADVRNRCRQFLISVCTQIKEKFPLDSKLLKLCSSFSVASCTKADYLLETPTLSDLAIKVPRIFTGNLNILDYEWRHIANIHIPEEIKSSGNPETLFLHLSTITDGDGQHSFTELPRFALNILSLPTSNADAERMISKLNLIRTKIRNNLSITTQTAMVVFSETVNSGGGPVRFKPSEIMIRTIQTTKASGNVDDESEILDFDSSDEEEDTD